MCQLALGLSIRTTQYWSGQGKHCLLALQLVSSEAFLGGGSEGVSRTEFGREDRGKDWAKQGAGMVVEYATEF